jgi:type I restriction enzyme S subunit
MINNNQHIPSGYKPSPLGIIPEDWEVKRLGEVCTFLDSQRIPIKDADRGKMQGQYPYYGASGIIDYVNDYIFDDDLILLGEDGANISTRSTPLAVLVSGKVWINNHAHVLKTNKGYNRYYICNYLESLSYDKYNTGTAQPKLNQEVCEKIPILVPGEEEQNCISNLLTLWDTAIAKQTALIEQLTLRKRGLMQQLLTGKKRLKGFSGEWKRIKAGEIFKSISVKGNGSEVLLSATQEYGVIPRDQLEGRVTMPTGDTNSFKLVEVGDFVISLRSFQGGLEYSEHRGIVSPAYTVLKPIVEIDKPYYRYYFKSSEFIGHLAIAVIGIRDGKQISYDDFCFVKIPYPNIDEQKAISAVLLQSDKEIEIQKQKLTALQEQKKGLMQVLLTGKRRVTI